jgi:hypothetical protein
MLSPGRLGNQFVLKLIARHRRHNTVWGPVWDGSNSGVATIATLGQERLALHGTFFEGVRKSLVFVWYGDGTVSAGSSKELAKVRTPSRFTT